MKVLQKKRIHDQNSPCSRAVIDQDRKKLRKLYRQAAKKVRASTKKELRELD